MVLLVPKVISSILKLGAMMVLIKAGFMPFCHSLEQRMELWHPANNVVMMHMGGTAQLFTRLWHWRLVRNMWRGGPDELHQSVRILLHLSQFCTRRQVRNPPYGPSDHVLPDVWMDESNSAAAEVEGEDEGEDEVEVCALCCHKCSTVTVCDEYKEHYCCECIDTRTCGNNVIC